VDPISRWLELYMHPVGPYLDDRSPYRLSLSCGVVLSVQYGAGMASDRTEMIVVPSVLAELELRAYLCQSGRVWLGLTSPRSSQGSCR
jgi:hypothetical protein